MNDSQTTKCICGFIPKNSKGLAVHQARCLVMSAKNELERMKVHRDWVDNFIQDKIELLSLFPRATS